MQNFTPTWRGRDGRIRCLLFFTFLITTAVASAQLTVTGSVTDPDGEPLIGVSIGVSGTSGGALTDFDGNYSLTVPNENAVLLFGYTGFKQQEVPIEGRTVVDVTLEPDVALLDEVVVIGYGTARKRDLTGSVSSLSGDELTSQPINTLEQGLAGRIAGVQIISNTSAPGGASVCASAVTRPSSTAASPYT